MSAPHELDASTLAARVKSGALSAMDVAESLIERVAARDADVRAWAYFDADMVRDRARELDAMPIKGALHGVPVGVKDVILTRDMPTQYNTARYQGARPGMDAACVDTLRAAGAIIAGKTVTTEFASTGRGGPTRNPLDLTRTPGGSSSGSGAAVADFQAALALGTQTGGSTIRPASYNGIFGWKPTWNSISREGLKMFSASCDTLGLYARSAADLALLADVFGIDALEEPAPVTLSGLRVGLCRSPAWEKATPATQVALARGAELLKASGAEVTELHLPEPFNRLPEAHHAILRREGQAAFLNEVRNTVGIHDEYRAMVENRFEITPQKARAAYRLADECRAAFDDIAAGYDIVLTPSATGEAPVGQDTTGDASFNSMWTILQVPVVNVPGLVGLSGMPVGLSLVARRYQDRKVIATAELVAAIFGRRRAEAA